MYLEVDNEANLCYVYPVDGRDRYIYIRIDDRWFAEIRPDCAELVELLYGN